MAFIDRRHVPRQNYGYMKRQKELAKQQKRAEKAQRRMDRATLSDPALEPTEAGDAPPAPDPES